MAILIGSGRVSHRFTVTGDTNETVTSSTGENIGPLSVCLTPGAGTALCEYRLHASDAWKVWPAGTVSAETTYRLNGAVQALRFTATTAAATVAISVE